MLRHQSLQISQSRSTLRTPSGRGITVTLDPSIRHGNEDGVRGGGDGAALMSTLKAYDVEHRRLAFDAAIHECNVCGEEGAGASAFVQMLGCSHPDDNTCVSCLKYMCAIHIREGSIEKLVCPDRECALPFNAATLRRILVGGDGDSGSDAGGGAGGGGRRDTKEGGGDDDGGTGNDGAELMVRWRTIKVARLWEGIEGFTHCPRCEDQGVETPAVPVEAGRTMCCCSKCEYVFCSLCRERYHPGTPCLDASRSLTDLQARISKMGANASADLRKKAAGMVVDLKSIQTIAQSTQRCPGCKVRERALPCIQSITEYMASETPHACSLH